MPTVQKTGHGGGGRRGRGAHVMTSLSEINVVPLVDVMLVLLIIFMITAPMMQQGLQVALPQSSRSTPVTAQPIYVTVLLRNVSGENLIECGHLFARLRASSCREGANGMRGLLWSQSLLCPQCGGVRVVTESAI